MHKVLTPANLKQLELLQLRSRRRFLGSRHGGNASLKRGHGIEFADYRTYELGDDPRHIDWGVFGRTDRLYVKQFQEEQDITFYCLLDSTASMHHPKSDAKFQAAAEIALGMSYVALSQHDRVKLTIPGGAELGPASGANFIYRLSELCLSAPVVSPEKHAAGLNSFLHSVRYPGICFYISDFFLPLPDIRAQFEALYAQNLDVTIVRITGAHDRDPGVSQTRAIYQDSETGRELPLEWNSSLSKEYNFRYQQHELELRQLINKYQFKFFSHNSESYVMQFFINKSAGSGVLQT